MTQSAATPEFSRTIRADQISSSAQSAALTASADELKALARRFALARFETLSAALSYVRDGEGVRVTGTLDAHLAQSCVVTGEPVDVTLAEPVDILFAPETSDGAEIELSADECDILPYDGKLIDLGEAVAQSVALALDPYPRAEGAEQTLRKAGILREDEVGAFGALAGLRDQLNRS